MLRFGGAQLKLRNRYTTESFYDRICSVQFEAGVPQLVKNGPAWIIAFPELDKGNQIQIRADRKGRIRVIRAFAPILLGYAPMEAGPDSKKHCLRLVRKTARQLGDMNL